MIRSDIDWEGLRGAFAEAQPFPHVVIDDFFELEVAQALEQDIPPFDDPSWMEYSNPIEEKRALRPNRSLIAACPTRPRLIAAIAGPRTQLAAACIVSVRAGSTRPNAKPWRSNARTRTCWRASRSRSDEARPTAKRAPIH